MAGNELSRSRTPPSLPPSPLQTIETACNDVKSSARLKEMLKCVLSVGNRINQADKTDHVRGEGGREGGREGGWERKQPTFITHFAHLPPFPPSLPPSLGDWHHPGLPPQATRSQSPRPQDLHPPRPHPGMPSLSPSLPPSLPSSFSYPPSLLPSLPPSLPPSSDHQEKQPLHPRLH